MREEHLNRKLLQYGKEMTEWARKNRLIDQNQTVVLSYRVETEAEQDENLEMTPSEFFTYDRCLRVTGSSAIAKRMARGFHEARNQEGHSSLGEFLKHPEAPDSIRYMVNFGPKCRHAMVEVLKDAGFALQQNWDRYTSKKWW